MSYFLILYHGERQVLEITHSDPLFGDTMEPKTEFINLRHTSLHLDVMTSVENVICFTLILSEIQC